MFVFKSSKNYSSKQQKISCETLSNLLWVSRIFEWPLTTSTSISGKVTLKLDWYTQKCKCNNRWATCSCIFHQNLLKSRYVSKCEIVWYLNWIRMETLIRFYLVSLKRLFAVVMLQFKTPAFLFLMENRDLYKVENHWSNTGIFKR
jgi:hypothetical protein